MDTLILRWSPLSTQHIYWQRWRIRYMKAEAKKLKTFYIWEIKKYYHWKNTIETPVAIDIKIYFWDRRRRDWDNYHKITMDALEWIIIEDDSLICDARVRKYLDKENPRTEIQFSTPESTEHEKLFVNLSK